MGWNHTDDIDGEHEGYVVGLLEAGRAGRYRELDYPADDKPTKLLDALQAGCDCGWRSRRIDARGATYHPFCVDPTPAQEEQLVRYWREHVKQEVTR